MKRIVAVFSLVVMAISSFAINEERDVQPFDKVNVSSAFNVTLQKGTTEHVSISGIPEEYINNVVTEVIDGELKIYVKGKVKAASGMKVTVIYQNLSAIDVKGAVSIQTEGILTTESMDIKAVGATNVDLEINAQTTSLNGSGASDIKLTGVTKNFDVVISGASSLHAKNFESNTVNIESSGAADVEVKALQEVAGASSGASDVDVHGNPPVNNLKTSGAADLRIGENFNMNLPNGKVSVNDDNVDVNLGNNNVMVEGDTTRIKWGNTNIFILDDSVSVKRAPKKRRNHWAGVDLGINGFISPKTGFNLGNDPSADTTLPQNVTQFMELEYDKSWVFNLNFFEYFLKIKEHHFGLVTGLGLEYNNYEFKHNVKLNPSGGNYVYDEVNDFNRDYTWGEIDTTRTYTKNRFKTFYINAPLMLEVNTGQHKNKSFHVSAGAIVGYKFKTKMKYKYRENGENTEHKYKDNQSFNTNPFRVSLTARVGYGWVNFFGTYSLTPLFEKNRGPELHAFSVGVTLLGF